MKTFEAPVLEIVEFVVNDVITTSPGGDQDYELPIG